MHVGSEHDVGVSELGGASDAGESEGGGGVRVRKRTRVTLNNYASYRMQFRPGQPNPMLWGCKLFEEHVVSGVDTAYKIIA